MKERVITNDGPCDLSTIQKWLAPGPSSRNSDGEGANRGPNWAIIDMIKVRRPSHGDGEDGDPQGMSPTHHDQLPHLQAALSNLNADLNPDHSIQALEIEGDTPSNDEWEVLGNRLRAVRWLAVDTGFDEDWEDGKFPQDWPLETLVISSACGILVTTPTVLDGRVPHLVLLLTSGLRFEGPDNNQLSAMNELDEQELDKDDTDVHQASEDQEGKRKLRIVHLPDRASTWLFNKYKDGLQFPNYEKPLAATSRLRTLEILENDAIDTFQRFAIARPHVVDKLERLNLRSTSGLDFQITPEAIFPQILLALENLKQLELSLSSHTFHEDDTLPNLYQSFPPNLESLKFRGPPTLAQSNKFEEWIGTFARADYLPKLKKLSFVLDGVRKRDKEDFSVDVLNSARTAADRLLNAAQVRGITTEEFHDDWTQLRSFQP